MSVHLDTIPLLDEQKDPQTDDGIGRKYCVAC